MKPSERRATELAFFVGVMVAERANGIETGKTPPAKIARVLEELVKGETTLLPGGAESRHLFPGTSAKNIEAGRKLTDDLTRGIAEVVVEGIGRTLR